MKEYEERLGPRPTEVGVLSGASTLVEWKTELASGKRRGRCDNVMSQRRAAAADPRWIAPNREDRPS